MRKRGRLGQMGRAYAAQRGSVAFIDPTASGSRRWKETEEEEREQKQQLQRVFGGRGFPFRSFPASLLNPAFWMKFSHDQRRASVGFHGAPPFSPIQQRHPELVPTTVAPRTQLPRLDITCTDVHVRLQGTASAVSFTFSLDEAVPARGKQPAGRQADDCIQVFDPQPICCASPAPAKRLRGSITHCNSTTTRNRP